MDLGVVVTIENPQYAAVVFRRATEAGFRFGQVNFACRPITPQIIREVAAAAKKYSFLVVSVGCSANLLRLIEGPMMGGDESDLITLCQHMSALDNCKRLVLWSGTYARRWTEPNLLNQGEDAYFAMIFEIHRLLGRLGGLPITIAIQPCYAHIVHDVATALRISEDFPDGRVCLALDAAYLIAPTVYARHPQILPQIISALSPMADIVCISDVKLEDGRIAHLLPGQGTLNFPALLKTLGTEVRTGTPHLLNAQPTSNLEELVDARRYLTEITIAE
jgi:sugar phosphate isomerase/epimerase